MSRIEETLATAREWQRKGDPDLEHRCRRHVAMNALREGVQAASPAQIAERAELALEDNLERMIALDPLTALQSDNCEAADLAIVLGRPDLARTLLEQSVDPYTGHGPIWVEYEAARIALLDGKPYSAPAGPIKAKGLLSTFVPYLALAEALSKGEDITAALADVDAAVRRRNSDKRMSSTTMIDGDGQIPAKWDLRRAVLLILGGRDPVTAEPVP